MGLWALLCATAGCHTQTAFVPPDIEDAASAVLVVLEPEQTRVFGIELGDEPQWPALAVAPNTQMHMLLFSCGLSRLGLDPGEIELESSIQSYELPPALRQAKLRLPEHQWTATTLASRTVMDALNRLPLGGDTDCKYRSAQLENVPTALPQEGHNLAAFVVGLTDGTGFVASKEGYYYRVWPDGLVRSIAPPIPVDPRAAHVMNDGTVFLLDSQGGLHRGTIESGFTRISSSPLLADAGSVSLTGPVNPENPLELFAATSQRALLRFDGLDWTVTATATGTATTAGEHVTITPPPGLIWMGTGRAAATHYGADGQSIAVYGPEGVRIFAPPPQVKPVGLAFAPDLGLLVGTARGPLFRLNDGIWARLEGGTRPPRGYSHLLRPLELGGLLIGQLTDVEGIKYGFGQWLPDLGFCPPEVLTHIAYDIAQIDEATWLLITVTNLNSNQAFDVAIIRQTAPPAACSGL